MHVGRHPAHAGTAVPQLPREGRAGASISLAINGTVAGGIYAWRTLCYVRAHQGCTSAASNQLPSKPSGFSRPVTFCELQSPVPCVFFVQLPLSVECAEQFVDPSLETYIHV